MPDYFSISYRGATYALGQGPHFYGIWYAAEPQGLPLEQWPLTPDGWTAAWSRFAAVEVPGTITPVTPAVAPMTGPAGPMAGSGGQLAAGPQAAGGATGWDARSDADPAAATRNGRIAAALVGVGLVLGLIGLFPAYIGGASVASQSFNLAPHVIYLVTWALSAALILTGGARMRAGALLGLGTSAITLGLFIADAGTAASAGSNLTGAGLVLTILGWLGCTAGLVLAAIAGRAFRAGLGPAQGLVARFASRPGYDIVPLVTLVLAAIGAAVAFAPSWDRYTLLARATGQSQTITLGNAFANAGPVIFGDILAMIAIVAVVVVAALWRPLRLGAALALGAAVPLVAQAISGIVQIREAVSPAQFGVSPSQASQLGLTIDSGLTAIFWVYCAFVGTLILLCVWMLVAHEPPVGSPVRPGAAPVWGGPASGGPSDGPGGPAGASPAVAPMTEGPAADGPVPDGPVPGTATAGTQWSGGSQPGQPAP
ncbi:MAG TPA: hypothetical protein VEV45_15805 [Streptosporangiaceae bacterium]|nr:hypothetical protein [Streptosporangiaceae bacterium]